MTATREETRDERQERVAAEREEEREDREAGLTEEERRRAEENEREEAERERERCEAKAAASIAAAAERYKAKQERAAPIRSACSEREERHVAKVASMPITVTNHCGVDGVLGRGKVSLRGPRKDWGLGRIGAANVPRSFWRGCSQYTALFLAWAPF